MTARPVVGVIGSGGEIAESVEALAREVGALIAQRGAVLVCGGLGGVMAAAARGARDQGGTVVGIIPSVDKADANGFVDIIIPTGLGVARNALVVHTADVLIVFPGVFGTLGEMAIAFETGKPVVCLPGAWDVRKAGQFGKARLVEAFDARQAVGLALGEIGRIGRSGDAA
ncbi:MAG: TIGR00725 family protein [Chitinispirillaceae bacterium]|jgi:hypothetical protein|nr:TIGR00725 family protein [Chitinispirillaceae bacterium]